MLQTYEVSTQKKSYEISVFSQKMNSCILNNKDVNSYKNIAFQNMTKNKAEPFKNIKAIYGKIIIKRVYILF